MKFRACALAIMSGAQKSLSLLSIAQYHVEIVVKKKFNCIYCGNLEEKPLFWAIWCIVFCILCVNLEACKVRFWKDTCTLYHCCFDSDLVYYVLYSGSSFSWKMFLIFLLSSIGRKIRNVHNLLVRWITETSLWMFKPRWL